MVSQHDPGSERRDLEPEPTDTIGIFRREVSFARTMSRPAWGTFGLMGLLSAVFLLTLVAHRWLAGRLAPIEFPYQAVVLLGAKHNGAIRAGETWRLGTHVLLHGNTIHLLMNLYALYVLGSVMERLYGRRRYFLLFLLCGLGGGVASYLFTAAPSVGASGAIFGLLGAAIVFGLRFGDLLPVRMRRVLTVGLLPWVVINMAIGFAFEQIDNAAHMGGMVTGALIALVLGTGLVGRSGRLSSGIQWVLLAFLTGFMVYGLAEAAQLVVGLGRLESPEEMIEVFRKMGILQ